MKPQLKPPPFLRRKKSPGSSESSESAGRLSRSERLLIWVGILLVAFGALAYFGKLSFLGRSFFIGTGKILGVVDGIEGRVRKSSSSDANFFELMLGDPLYVGDQISTEAQARVRIRFKDGEIIEIGENTLVSLDLAQDSGTVDVSRPAAVKILKGAPESVTATPKLIVEKDRVRIQVEAPRAWAPAPRPSNLPSVVPSVVPSAGPSQSQPIDPRVTTPQKSAVLARSVRLLMPENGKVFVGSKVFVEFQWDTDPKKECSVWFMVRKSVSGSSDSDANPKPWFERQFGCGAGRWVQEIPALPSGEYIWELRRSDRLPVAGSEWRRSFKVQDESTALKIKSIGDSKKLTLNWTSVRGANDYEIAIWDGPDLKRKPIRLYRQKNLTSSFAFDQITAARVFVKVQALSKEGKEISAHTLTWIKDLKSPLVSPIEASSVRWSPIPFIKKYRIEFYSGANSDRVIGSEEISTTRYSLPAGAQEAWVRVRAITPDQVGESSTMIHLTRK